MVFLPLPRLGQALHYEVYQAVLVVVVDGVGRLGVVVQAFEGDQALLQDVRDVEDVVAREHDHEFIEELRDADELQVFQKVEEMNENSLEL
eukprot:CAMPEP_0170497266 /NCGR_PEP_ID=MMETSP0208-20121228/24239_1 /TAXON_ID=197538 /ORGANISM="Strombidium inclinatum, Strain S3" /LENGTH=90 /DNA_ID=CAMNT_0010774035 /DNA_START=721 /DNA_END=993 /DNA_ORIENTATION=+